MREINLMHVDTTANNPDITYQTRPWLLTKADGSKVHTLPVLSLIYQDRLTELMTTEWTSRCPIVSWTCFMVVSSESVYDVWASRSSRSVAADAAAAADVTFINWLMLILHTPVTDSLSRQSHTSLYYTHTSHRQSLTTITHFTIVSNTVQLKSRHLKDVC